MIMSRIEDIKEDKWKGIKGHEEPKWWNNKIEREKKAT